ncbi:DcuS/MalK family sensor histidine kinase [Anaerosinus massiliensis]|uniref:DcuS/MalK family sensor histidine kinase n=1 Tax=Massilibacillus massiliensis TaxID=1806837 RepID=UPI000A449236|nr:DcuS/MalK family sensor histidine kinase [Massilibacillus massiliensis]
MIVVFLAIGCVSNAKRVQYLFGEKGFSMRANKSFFSLQNNFVILTFLVILVSLLVTDFLISDKIGSSTYEQLNLKAVQIANVMANTPVVVDGLINQKDEDEIQTFSEKIREISDVHFIVVMDMNRIRKSHPDRSKIGTYYETDDADEAFAGKSQTSVAHGSLGESLRVFSPVYTEEGNQIGVVLVGIMIDEVSNTVSQSRYSVLFGSICGLLIGMVGAFLLARHIKKMTFGLEPFVIAKMLEERNAILASVREGIFAVDRNSRITVINTEALRLFHKAGINDEAVGKDVEAFVPNTRMQNVLKTGVAELDQEQELEGVTLLTNRVPICVNGEIVGVVATFRDKTEMRKLAEKLVDLKIYAEALRAQTHEFMNKLHVIIGMLHMQSYDELKEYVMKISHQYQLEIGTVVKKIKDPIVAGFLLGKLSWAREAGIEMELSESCFLPDMADSELVNDLIVIMGNLIDNAVDAVAKEEIKKIDISIVQICNELKLEVRDTGGGISQEAYENIYKNGFSTKGENRGVGLYILKRSIKRLRGRISFISEVGKGTTFYVNLPYRSEERFFD